MPPELRFCRNCGCRLGEDVAEYTETVRFSGGAYAPPLGGAASPFGNQAGQLQPVAGGKACRRKRRFSGMTWIFVAVMMVFIVGFSASFLAKKAKGPGGSFPFQPAPPRTSYFGVSGFETTDGGVTFDKVEPPGSPADLAGLVGGDVVTTFDGHPIYSDSEMAGRLAETPVGKTVEVVFIRDGETKLTKLTTISKIDFDQLVSAFRRRPEGQGRMGINIGKQVEIPGTKIHGVRVAIEDPSRAAALAGMKDDDIITAFDSVPIRTPEELDSRIRRAIPYNEVIITVMRGGERLEIPVKMGKRS
jgi:S1-C subfamily serine protease